jgi:hypothetical protein
VDEPTPRVQEVAAPSVEVEVIKTESHSQEGEESREGEEGRRRNGRSRRTRQRTGRSPNPNRQPENAPEGYVELTMHAYTEEPTFTPPVVDVEETDQVAPPPPRRRQEAPVAESVEVAQAPHADQEEGSQAEGTAGTPRRTPSRRRTRSPRDRKPGYKAPEGEGSESSAGSAPSDES